MKMQKISVGTGLAMAFGLWRKTMKYNALFSLVYYSAFILLMIGAGNYVGFWEKYLEITPYLEEDVRLFLKKYTELMTSKVGQLMFVFQQIGMVLVSPLWVGLLLVLQKRTKQETVDFSDLFVGYNGMNFFKYAGFCFLSTMISSAFNLYSLLGLVLIILWTMQTLLVFPIMFFQREPMGISMLMSFQAMRHNFFPMLILVIVGTLFIYSGMLFFWIGIIFTMPFWATLVFSIYQQIFNDEIKNEK